GCVPEVLATFLGLIRFAPRMNELWSETLGRIDRRQKALRLLAKAAEALKDFYIEFPVPANANTPIAKTGQNWAPSILSEIESHNQKWALFDLVAAEAKVNSIPEMAKYLLVAYVKRATGRFHDRNASALLGEILGSVNYDEVAHRMWRNRNYERLEQALSMCSDLLLDLSLAVSRRT